MVEEWRRTIVTRISEAALKAANVYLREISGDEAGSGRRDNLRRGIKGWGGHISLWNLISGTYLADPGEARGCSTKTFVINSLTD